MATLTSDVFNALQKGKASNREIARFVLGNQNSVRSALARLVNQGKARRIGRGRYEPIEPEPPSPFFEGDGESGWYLSGLSYNRDIGLKVYGIEDIEEAERLLREYAEKNVEGYNDGFYGIGSIDYDGFSQIGKIIEVNL